MTSDKEKTLVALIFAHASRTIVVVGESDAVFGFAKSLAQDVVEAVRTANADVHPHALAEYVVTRLNRFANAETRAAVIQESIDVGASAAAFEQDALVALGLDGAGLRGQSGLRTAPDVDAANSPAPSKKRTVALGAGTVTSRANIKGRAKQSPDGVGAADLPGSVLGALG